MEAAALKCMTACEACTHTHTGACSRLVSVVRCVLHVGGLHPNTSAFGVERAVSCSANDQLTRAVACTLSPVPPGLPSIAVHGLPLNWSVFKAQWRRRPGGRGESPPSCVPRPQISSVVTAGETVLFWFLQDSEGAQPLNLSAKPKASESKSPNSPPTSPQVPAAAAGATKLGHAGSGKHSAPSTIGGPPTRMSSIGKRTCLL